MAATVKDNATPAAAVSPRPSSGGGIAGSQPLPRRSSPNHTKNSPPPWNQVVRGPEAEVLVAPPAASVTAVVLSAPTAVEDPNSGQSKMEGLTEGFESETHQEGSENGNGNGSKKPAWNKPSNGAPEIGPVMGAVSWPSLSESTKASPKPPASDLSKIPSDAPVSLPQVTSTATLSSPASSSSAPLRHITSNPNNPNPSATQQHHGRPARQKSMKREGGGGLSSNGGFSHQPPPQSSLVGEAPRDSSSSVKSGFGGSDSSGRDHHGHHNAYREVGQRGGGDHSQHRNHRRSNNGGPHLRGDGPFGSRRDQDRANPDWNHHRNFNGRDNAVPPQRAGPRSFIRHPPSAAPYIPPPPIGPYNNPMTIHPPHEVSPLYYFNPHPGMSFVPQMPPAFYRPPIDPRLLANILYQINYYFSNENLIRDTFLRRNMDEHGWVPVQLIATFKQVAKLTTNTQLILDAVRASTVVEVQGDKIRKRDDWMRWLMPASVQIPTAPSSQSPRISGQDALAAQMQGLAVDENSANQSNSSSQPDIHAGKLLRSSSGEANLHLETSKDGSSSNGRFP